MSRVCYNSCFSLQVLWFSFLNSKIKYKDVCKTVNVGVVSEHRLQRSQSQFNLSWLLAILPSIYTNYRQICCIATCSFITSFWYLVLFEISCTIRILTIHHNSKYINISQSKVEHLCFPKSSAKHMGHYVHKSNRLDKTCVNE